MGAQILPFDPSPRDLIVIELGIVVRSDVAREIGKPLFFLRHVSKDGGEAVVWDGPSHRAAFNAAGRWMIDGCHLVDRTGVLDV